MISRALVFIMDFPPRDLIALFTGTSAAVDGILQGDFVGAFHIAAGRGMMVRLPAAHDPDHLTLGDLGTLALGGGLGSGR